MSYSFQSLVRGCSNGFDFVYMDLDGVMVDNHAAAVRTAGKELVTPGKWEIDFDFDGQSYEWWMANEPTKELDGCLQLLSRYNVRICTARPIGTPAVQAAYDWVRRYAPAFPRKHFIFCHEKQMLAAQGRLLIDDADHNIDAWTEAGGQGCLVPRRWNSKGHEAT